MTKTKNNSFLRIFAGFLFLIGTISTNYADAREMTEYPRVKLQTLDKATARTMTFNAKVGSTIRFGPLYIRVESCQKASPIDKPESAAFLEVWEVDTDDNAQWVFSGWMFASSPGLSPMDHPIYDVWVLDCLDYDKNTGDTTTPDNKTVADGNDNTADDGATHDTAHTTEPPQHDNPNHADNQDLLE